MCVAVMKEMNHIFKEENVNAEVVLYEVKYVSIEILIYLLSFFLFRFFQLIKLKVLLNVLKMRIHFLNLKPLL